MVRTFYDVLGVSPTASVAEIEDAYREQLKATHPDVSDEESGADAVKVVIEAGDVLTDADERARYDRLGHETYVAVTDAYDPSVTQRDRSESVEEDRPESPSRPSGAERAPPGTDETARRRSTSSGDVHTANANPEGVSWANGTVQDTPYETEERGYTPSTSERPILFLAALVAYPILIFAAAYPEFLLPFRIVIAACGIMLIIYLVSVPAVSVPAFGILTLVAATVVFFAGIPVPSVVSVGAIVVTAGPFALALFAHSFRL